MDINTDLYVVSEIIDTDGSKLGYWTFDTFGYSKAYSIKALKNILKSGANIKGIETRSDGTLGVTGIPGHNTVIDLSNWEYGHTKFINRLSDYELQQRIRIASNKNARLYVNEIVEYVSNDKYDRLVSISGLGGTGKTMSLYHTIKQLKQLGETRSIIFLTVSAKTDGLALLNSIEQYRDSIMFIDDVHRIKGLADCLILLTNIVCNKNKLKIIISGVNAYSLYKCLEGNVENGGIISIGSTIVTYKEFVHLFNKAPLDMSSYENYKKLGTLEDVEKSTNTTDIVESIISKIERSIDEIDNSTSELLPKVGSAALNNIAQKLSKMATLPTKRSTGRDRNILTALYKGNNKLKKLANIKDEDMLDILDYFQVLGLNLQILNMAQDIVEHNKKIKIRRLGSREILSSIPLFLEYILRGSNEKEEKIKGIMNENMVLLNLVASAPKIDEDLVVGFIKYDYGVGSSKGATRIIYTF